MQVATALPPWASSLMDMKDGPLTVTCAFAAVDALLKLTIPSVAVIVAFAALEESQKSILESNIPPPTSNAAEPAEDVSKKSKELPPAESKLTMVPAVAEFRKKNTALKPSSVSHTKVWTLPELLTIPEPLSVTGYVSDVIVNASAPWLKLIPPISV